MSARFFRTTLPWPRGVTGNHLYQPRARGQRGALVPGARMLTPAARAWLTDAQLAARRTRDQWLADGPLAMVLFAYAPDQRRRDLDNLHKVAQDVIFRAYGDDDARVIETHSYRLLDRENPRIEIVLTPAGQSDHGYGALVVALDRARSERDVALTAAESLERELRAYQGGTCIAGGCVPGDGAKPVCRACWNALAWTVRRLARVARARGASEEEVVLLKELAGRVKLTE